jgi:predicted GIY-YIG superfamily endonuclease
MPGVPEYHLRQPRNFVLPHTPLNKQQRIIELDKRIELLLRERSTLKREIKEEAKAYKIRTTTIKLYALRLEDNCWYIGQSWDVEQRFKRHVKGKGARWTKLHMPIEVAEIRDTKVRIDSEAAKLEDSMTLEYATRYGVEVVRGGGYCQAKPRWPSKNAN